MTLIAFTAVAIATLAIAFLQPPDATGIPASADQQSCAADSAPSDASARHASADVTTRSVAESSRDAALAARFASVKSEAKRFAPELHMAAQRKEIEAEAAQTRGDFAGAVSLYDSARDGYRIAASRAEVLAAAEEKARVDDQLTADARVAAQAQMRTQYAQVVEQQPAGAVRGPLILEAPPPSEGAGRDPATGGMIPPQPPSVENLPRSAAGYGAVYAEPTDGRHSGGTWGACWRSDPEAARQCARANCEGRASRGSCNEIAFSRPGEHCAVARAPGFGVSSGACAMDRAQAAAAAVERCRVEVAGRYGEPAPCSVAWSSAR